MERRRTEVRGVPMAWLESGQGPPVVLVHGIPTGPSLWRRVAPLIPEARLFALELVGFADSIPAGRGRDISVSRQADYLLAWMGSVGIDRAVLVGHDIGGGVAQIAAVRAPERCAGLVLANSIGYDSWPIPSVRAMKATAPLLARLPAAVLRPAIAPLFVRGHDDRGIGRESLDLHWRPYERHGAGGALTRQVRALHTRDTLAVAPALRELRLPARIVWGEADPFQKIEYGERFAWDLDAPLTRIPGASHFTPEDHPAEIADAVRRVLAAGEPPR